MLYKNDEIYKMTNENHREINKMYPKFPIRLIYPEGRVKKSRSKHNRLPDKPNSISFPLKAAVKTDKGVENWRYAENKIIGTNGRTIWQPHNLILRGSMILESSDIELIFWLVKCCPFLQGGENWNEKVAKCVIEDLRGAAEIKAKKEEEMATVKAMIYSSTMGMGEKKLRLVAKAYFVMGVDELSYAQVKLAVENTIMRNKRTGIKDFLEMVEAEQVVSVRSSLQNAIDRELITYMVTNKQWAWVTGQGRKNEPICQIGAGADPSEALYDYYLGTRGFAQELVAALKGKTVVMAAGAGGPDDELDPE
jgi:hypothetical protein